MRHRPPLVASLLALVLASAPASAGKEWYDYYLDAKDKLIPRGQYDEAIANLRAAIRIKPESALHERTYGMEFEDYLPYYWEGVCHLRKGDWNAAILIFNIE